MFILNILDAIALWFISLVTKSPKKQEALHQFFKFGMIGVVNTVIDFIIYYLLTRYTEFFDPETARRYLANVIGFMTGATFSFFANKWWTFKHFYRPTVGEISKFYGTNVTGLILNTVLFGLAIKLFAVHDLVAKIFATIFTIIWNFVLQKFWVFRKKNS
ncbi:GtrA family protein [Patescibacteria group bacterium]|nr:GtrA family protein [Patescibacteria group bacterium]